MTGDNLNNKIDNKNVTQDRKSKNSDKNYNVRLCFCLAIFVISYICCVLLINKSFNYQNAKTIEYKDEQTIDYKVYLKDNNFYEQDYLDKDMIYVASLIDNININFNYKFSIKDKLDLDLDYKIIANLVISSPTDNNKQYFNKQYVLLDRKTKSIKDSNTAEIKENLVIDYDYYNDLASSFKTQFVVDTDSYLNVYMEITKKSGSESDIKINDKSVSSIKIPLSKRSVDIKFDVPDTSDTKDVVIDGEFIFNKKIVALEALIILVTIISLIKLIKLIKIKLPKKSKYDRFIRRILREYDRLIVETTTSFDEKSNIININEFEELLDVRDNLKLPIMYYVVEKDRLSYFYIKDDDDIYLFKLDYNDLENKEV